MDKLRKERDPQALYQAQGRLEVLDKMLSVKQEFRDFAGKVMRGEVKLKGGSDGLGL